ncbi:cytochrome P450 [Usnea florida]
MVSYAIFDTVVSTVSFHTSSLLSIVLLSSLVALLVWRLWVFTVIPALYPNDPKEFPYWFPIIGHLVSFYRNPNALQSSARLGSIYQSPKCPSDNLRKYFNGSRQPFTITIAGTKLYILTDPSDISKAYMSSSSLSFDRFVKLLIRTCGSSKEVVDKLYQNSPSRNHDESLGGAIHGLQVEQSSGQKLEDLSAVLLMSFERSLLFKELAKDNRYSSKPSETATSAFVSLKKWCSVAVINASQKAYFGDCLSKIDPDLSQTFIEFDSRSWQLLYHFPRLFSEPMYAAKDRLISSLTAYFEAPLEEKTDASWVTQRLEREMRDSGFTNREMGTLMMLQYWGINTNTHKACFWMMCYMLFEPGLLELIRTETAKAFYNGSLDFHYLENSCPRLRGLWLEMLRLTVSSSSIRYVMKDTTIGGKGLRSGNVLINSCRQLHFNEAIFGEDVSQFDSTRFFENPKLEFSSSWKPFGGGISLCPGRRIAKRAAYMFIALVLNRFEVKLAFTQPFPKSEQTTPDLGVFMSSDDLVLTIRERSTE